MQIVSKHRDQEIKHNQESRSKETGITMEWYSSRSGGCDVNIWLLRRKGQFSDINARNGHDWMARLPAAGRGSTVVLALYTTIIEASRCSSTAS